MLEMDRDGLMRLSFVLFPFEIFCMVKEAYPSVPYPVALKDNVVERD